MGNGVLYFRDGMLVAKSGEVSIYRMNNELFLEIGPGHNLWALESEVKDYIEQLGDKPRGECLEIGLGLGIASRCILSYPKVDRLTTVELNKDIIQAHGQIIPLLDKKSKEGKWAKYNANRHIILNCDGLSYLYSTKYRFDFIFLDFYAGIDEESLPVIADMVKAAKKVLNKDGSIIGWLDPYTPTEFISQFNNLFSNKEEIDGHELFRQTNSPRK